MPIKQLREKFPIGRYESKTYPQAKVVRVRPRVPVAKTELKPETGQVSALRIGGVGGLQWLTEQLWTQEQESERMKNELYWESVRNDLAALKKVRQAEANFKKGREKAKATRAKNKQGKSPSPTDTATVSVKPHRFTPYVKREGE